MSAMIPAWVKGSLKPVEKLQVHRDGLKHKAVSVLVMRGREMLIQQRALHKYHTPGLWANACCTHPAWNESAADCAIRRLDEELGITDLTPEFRERLEYRADVGNNLIEHEVVDVFYADAKDLTRIAPNPSEVMAVDWVTLDRLMSDIEDKPERFTPWFRIYLKEYSATILGAPLLI
ncbi:MAG: isopentenyl-diphosphate delta-isomerase [Pseudomonadota bacterium]